jgi:hypothetical protein
MIFINAAAYYVSRWFNMLDCDKGVYDRCINFIIHLIGGLECCPSVLKRRERERVRERERKI